MTSRAHLALLTVVAFACGNGALLAPAAAAPKKLLDYHAYSAWRQIRDVRLSRDGRRLAYAQVPAEADGELLVRELGGTAVFRAPRGRAPQFSPDGRFVVYRISAPVADVKAAEKATKPPDQRPKEGLGIADLADVANAKTTTVDRVRSFALARDGTTLAYLLEPSPSASPAAPASPAASRLPSSSPAPTVSVQPSPSPHPIVAASASAPPRPAPSASPAAAASSAPKGPGKDAPTSLGIRRLGDADATRVANVSAYAVSADGSHVAYVVQTKADESVHVRDVASGTDQVVAHGGAHLVSPALSPDGATLAYLSDPDAYDESVKKEAGARSPFRLMVADTRGGAAVEALGPATPGLAPHTYATDARTPEFSADGRRLALWTANVPLPRPSSAPARIDLDFWYWRDGELPTQQRRAAQNPQHGTYLALYDVAARRVTQLGTRDVPDVALAGNARYALGWSDVPYVKLATYDDAYFDVYRIDVATGARRLLERKAKTDAPTLSPTGRYAAGYDPLRRAWYTLRLADGRKTWITDPRTVRAAQEDDDHPAPPPAYGFGGWTPGDRGVLVYDRYDVWLASPDGGPPVALTRGAGRAAQRIYRVVHPRTDEPDSAFLSARPVFAARTVRALRGGRPHEGERLRRARVACAADTAAHHDAARQSRRRALARARRRRPRVHRAAIRRISRPVVERRIAGDGRARERCEPASRAVRVGPLAADRLHERARREAARGPHRARRLRCAPALPDARLRVREDVERAAHVRRPAGGDGREPGALCEPRLRGAAARHSLPHRAHDRERDRLRAAPR